ncbi:MAG: hypothetical protein EP343_30155 [Deltaproteobacteria bacterium]|nr:MAG: hypothetical protein EP343_30155 [Deltaproteobacteria bacterium]
MKHPLLLWLLSLSLFCLAPSWSNAQIQPTPSKNNSPVPAKAKKSSTDGWGWNLSIEARTDVPILIGGHIALEMPYGFRISTTLGVLPPFYVDMVNAIVVASGGYNQETADLIKRSLSSALVWRLHVGWRPSPYAGFYIEVGYGLVTLGGQAASEDIIRSAIPSLPVGFNTGRANWDVASSLHMIDAELGWRWSLLNNHMTIRISLGFAGTLGSNTTAKPDAPFGFTNPDIYGRAIARYLDQTYRSYIFSPTLGFAMGYRF